MDEGEWVILREMRLAALRESPGAFLSSYSDESAYEEQKWRAEFRRGEWTIEVRNDKAIALVGITREQCTPPNECYLEYMWVSPGFRRRGVATDLIKNVLRRLLNRGFATIWLWVLDGNEPARRFYEKCGFISTRQIQRPHRSPSRSEELMSLTFRQRCP
jgi:ribosomal protein S18 acetylase RimI-like enzyme